MTEKRPKKQVRDGCLSKSLEDFLYLNEEKRFKKYGYDVNKYYQRVVNNVNRAVSDLTFAYEKLPSEQRKKIQLLNQTDELVGYLIKIKYEGRPKKIIRSTKKQLHFIIDNYVRPSPIHKLMEPDFERIYDWLQYLTPKNLEEEGASV